MNYRTLIWGSARFLNMTSDGITSDDWQLVREIVVDIVNADSETKAAACTSRLLAFLDDLEEKYGTLPSILATRADFIDDPAVSAVLLNDAYCLAELTNDEPNALHTSHSLAQLYVDEMSDPRNGKIWLERLRLHLDRVNDAWYLADYERLTRKIG